MAVEKEQERVEKKLEVLSSTTSSKLQMVIDQINSARSRITDG